MIQSGCSIYRHFLKPFHQNIHELCHKAPIAMKIIVRPLRPSNGTLDLLFVFLKFSWFLWYIVLNLFLFSPDFLKIFHNAVMIYYIFQKLE